MVICNFILVVCLGYKIGLLLYGNWKEVLNSDVKVYGGLGDYYNIKIIKIM